MRGVVFLPLHRQIAVGKRLGRPLARVLRKERRTALRNLEICFPELCERERAALVQRHFEALGASFVEMAVGWFMSIERRRKLIRVEGREHLRRAIEKGHGVILLAAHFTTMEVCASILEDLCDDCSCMYRPQRNAMLDALIRRGRSRFASTQIPSDDVRALFRSLKRNSAVVYLPDQTYLGRQSEMLPFFGEPALTNIATSKIAKLTGAVVLPYFFRRLDDDSGYVVNIEPPLEDFPSNDPLEDTRRLTRLLEQHIRKAPEQYLWTYRKFKRRPQPYPDLYAEAPR